MSYKNFGGNFKNTPSADYDSDLDATIQIIEGARDIISEVAGSKIGLPWSGEDDSYIESPYAYNSIIDFYDNIAGCKYALNGAVGAETPNEKSLIYFCLNAGNATLKTQAQAVQSKMDYRCTIDIGQDGKTERMIISMNNIGKASGYRFYQSSYDDDGQGTHLLVAHDPYGIAVTYVGYLMLFVSLLWTVFSRHTRIRQLYRMATRPLVFVFVFVQSAHGQTPTPVSSEIAHELGKVAILYNGRICPINTAATDFVSKLSGKPSWNGYSADEIFTGWMIFYTEWEQQKIIRIKSAEVQHILGIEDQWASVRDFYTSEGEYKLRGKSNDSNLPDATRKAIREADEKMQVISMFYSNEMFRMFPLEEKWHAPGSTELPLGTPEREFQFINHAMDHLVQTILADDVSGAKQIIAKIRLYQEEKVGEALPSKMMIGIEVFYNKLLSARWVTFLCLTLSLLLCLLSSFLDEPSVSFVAERKCHLFVLLAFLTVLMTYFGVNYFLSGMHSYA